MNSSFPNKKEHFVKKRSSFMTNNEESNVCRSSTFQVNRTKNATGKRRLTSSNRATMSALHRKNDTTNLFGYKLGELTEINKALLFFSGNFFNSISSTWELPCLKILQRSNFGTNFERMI